MLLLIGLYSHKRACASMAIILIGYAHPPLSLLPRARLALTSSTSITGIKRFPFIQSYTSTWKAPSRFFTATVGLPRFWIIIARSSSSSPRAPASQGTKSRCTVMSPNKRFQLRHRQKRRPSVSANIPVGPRTYHLRSKDRGKAGS
jgi:hypothetical protein